MVKWGVFLSHKTLPCLCPCPNMDCPLQSQRLPSCTGNRDGAQRFWHSALCASGLSFLPWYPMTKGRIHLIRCRNLLWDSYLDSLWSTKRKRNFKGKIYPYLKLGIDRESDELHPISVIFSPLPIVGTWSDCLVDRCFQPNHILGDINVWYSSNVLGQGIFPLVFWKSTSVLPKQYFKLISALFVLVLAN